MNNKVKNKIRVKDQNVIKMLSMLKMIFIKWPQLGQQVISTI